MDLENVKPAEVKGVGAGEMKRWVLSEAEGLLIFSKGSSDVEFMFCLANWNYGLVSVPKGTDVGLGLFLFAHQIDAISNKASNVMCRVWFWIIGSLSS